MEQTMEMIQPFLKPLTLLDSIILFGGVFCVFWIIAFQVGVVLFKLNKILEKLENLEQKQKQETSNVA